MKLIYRIVSAMLVVGGLFAIITQEVNIRGHRVTGEGAILLGTFFFLGGLWCVAADLKKLAASNKKDGGGENGCE